jgi:DNA-directed RNA polymerase subunit RPC12/RpoP
MNYKQANERYDYALGNAEDSVVFVRHCERCNIGVYSEHKEEDGKRCTYCGDKELIVN